VPVVVSLVVSLALAAGSPPAPVAGLALDGSTTTVSVLGVPVRVPVRAPTLPRWPWPPIPVPPLPIPLPVPGRGGRPGRRRGRRRGEGTGETLFIYVPGHGGDPDGFADLARRMGTPPDRVQRFDYTMVGPWNDPVEASKWVPVDDAADVLAWVIEREAQRNRRIYVVGHSKGGAVVTQMIANWDAGIGRPPPELVGAALLDPAIAPGGLGALQRLGTVVGDVPDNGGFDPIRCGPEGCRDVRVGLGRRSGIEVIAIRNREALVMNFLDDPDGLRVYDVDSPAGDPFARFLDPLGSLGDAHRSMLHDDATASCIAAEASRPGSCRWRAASKWRLRPFGRGRGAGPLVE